MTIGHDQINRWANPPSETENSKCENAISQITDALRARFGNDISFIRQGSHRNRTNIRLDSDVDIAVVHNDYYFSDTDALSESDKILYEKYRTPATYSFSQFKADVYATLQSKFIVGVERKNKCIRVNGSSTRVNADVVPAYGHKRFRSFGVSSVEGIELVTDSSARICSFPDQHYENGVAKNDSTNRSFKAVVRILKNLRNHFAELGQMKVEDMPSFFIESLVWNAPAFCFTHTTWREDAASVALNTWSDMRDPAKANDYAEVCDLRWLFRGQTHRTPKQAEDFMLKAWSAMRE